MHNGFATNHRQPSGKGCQLFQGVSTMSEQYNETIETSTGNGVPCANQVQSQHSHGADEHTPAPTPESISADQWRDTVLAITQRAATKMPEVQDRLGHAMELVLAGHVRPWSDNPGEKIAYVSSQTEKHTSYRVNSTCTCPNFLAKNIPEYWCKHRLAWAIYRQAKKALEPVEVPASEPVNPHLAPYVPAHTSEVYVKINGYRCKFLLQHMDVLELAAAAEELTARYQ